MLGECIETSCIRCSLTGDRWFGLARAWEPWLCPVHGKDRFDTDKSVIMASFMSSEGLHLVALAVSGVNDVNAFIKPSESGGLVLYVSSLSGA